jgi:hypothetical protein
MAAPRVCPLHTPVATAQRTPFDHQTSVVRDRRTDTAKEATQLHATLRRQRIPEGSVEGFKL